MNLHLSDDTIFKNASSSQKQPSTSFQTYRQRKRTDSTGFSESDSSATSQARFNADIGHKFGSRPPGAFDASTNSDSSGNKTTGQSTDNDDSFLKPQDSAESRDRSARASRSNSRQASPTRTTPQRSRQTSPIPGPSNQQRTRDRSRSNLREDLTSRFSGKEDF